MGKSRVYTAWMHGDANTGRELSGSYLEAGCEQSAQSSAWLALWTKMITADSEYRERIRRHYRLFKDQEADEDLATPEQYGIPPSGRSFPDAEAELARVLRRYDIEKYVSIDRVRSWCGMLNATDADSMAPFAILMGLAAEWEDASRETIEDIIGAFREFWNALPREELRANSPNEVAARRWMENKAPHLTNSLIEFGRWVPHYNTALVQLHAAGEEETAVDEFRTVFRLLLEEHTTSRHVFRIYANAAIACFGMGDEYGGVRLLKIASEINPNYDFARDQMERYTSGKIDDLIIAGIARRAGEELEVTADSTKRAGVLKQRGVKNAFMHLRAITSMLGILDDAKKRTPLAQMPLPKQEEREARKRFEKEPWHAYYLFLKKFGINFNHPLEEPSYITFHRADGAKIGRNESCPCGSGKKYKKCHG